MLKKRLIGTIIVKGGLAVQSFGYRRYLPLGRPDVLAGNLDRWGCDEILVLNIDRSRQNLGPDIELLKRLGAIGLSTPLIYGGGVRTAEQAAMVIHNGADRVCLDSALHHESQPIRDMAILLGSQALIGAFPVSMINDKIQWRDYRCGNSKPFTETSIPVLEEGVISEALLIDWLHEGVREGFDRNLIDRFPFPEVPLIAFGGISEPNQAASLLALTRVVAVAVGNFLNYKELAVQQFKDCAIGLPVRPANYMSSLLAIDEND